MSSNDVAIRVQNLSKCYEIYTAPRERLKQFVLPPLQGLAGKPAQQYFGEFWALKDVSFEVKKGEAIGISGRNGSGKSTLLQMICGTLNPTGGSIQTRGRVAALLELGSGFNPEFTGRKNVYMNASVQNLCQSGIWLKNGGIEQIGTAKSVSEAYFQYTQQEIYGTGSKLISIAPAVTRKETRIEEAVINTETPPAIDYRAVAAVRDNLGAAKGWKTGQANIVSVSLSHLSPGTEGVFEGGERVRMTVRAKAHEALQNPILGFLVRDRLGQDLFGENTLPFTSRAPTQIRADTTFDGVFDFRLPMPPNGQYAVMASVADGDLHVNVQHHWMHDALIINVSSKKIRWGLVGIAFERVEIEVIDE